MVVNTFAYVYNVYFRILQERCLLLHQVLWQLSTAIWKDNFYRKWLVCNWTFTLNVMGCAQSCCANLNNKELVYGVPVEPSSIPIPITAEPSIRDSVKPRLDNEPVHISLEPISESKHVVAGYTMAMGDSSSIMNLYNKYVNPEMGQISAEGIEQLCDDLELNPEDFRVLVLAYSLGAQVMCRFTEEEFVKGCDRHGITSLESMKQAIPKLLNTVKGSLFTEFYHWTYKFALDFESGQRTLPMDMALSLWKLVFSQNYPPILDKWLNYLSANTTVKGISKDTWDMFLIFVNQIGDDLESYDDSEAWPSLLDDFVEFELNLGK